MAQDDFTLDEFTDGDCYVSSQSSFPDDRDTNFNNNELNVGVFNFGLKWRMAIRLNIAARYPAGTIFDEVIFQMTRWLSQGSGTIVLEFQKILPPQIDDGQVTHINRIKGLSVPWLSPGIDVVAAPPAIVSATINISDQLLSVTGFEEMFQDGYDNESGLVQFRGRRSPETGSDKWLKFRSSAYSVAAQRPKFLVTYSPPLLLGYKLFLSPGIAPNPAVDSPVVTVDSTAVSAVLDMNTLGLVPNSGYYGLVTPFNTVGNAPTSAPFGFWTDGAGLPLLIPAPVSRLTAKPLAGGNVQVSWVYDEPNPLATAATFEIEVFDDTSSFPFSVPHGAPQRKYTRDLTVGSDGLFQVRVKSDKGGLTQANVSPVAVMLDATPPAVVPVTLSAT